MENVDAGSRHNWASSLFGLEPEAAPQTVRAAVMSHLDDADFMPPVAWRQAIRELCNPQSSQAGQAGGHDAFREDRERRLAEEVDQFAAEFFSLERGPRRLRWTQLLKMAAAFPRLRARLAVLQPGLDAESTSPDDSNSQDALLVDRIRSLFLLKPGDQDQRRRQWLAAMTGDWRPVIRRVKAKFPKLAQLDVDFMSALMSSRHGPAAATANEAVAARTNLAAAIITSPKTAAGGKTLTRTNANSNSGSSSGVSRWVIILFVLLGGRLVAFLSSQSANNSSQPNILNTQEIDKFLKRDPTQEIEKYLKSHPVTSPRGTEFLPSPQDSSFRPRNDVNRQELDKSLKIDPATSQLETPYSHPDSLSRDSSEPKGWPR